MFCRFRLALSSSSPNLPMREMRTLHARKAEHDSRFTGNVLVSSPITGRSVVAGTRSVHLEENMLSALLSQHIFLETYRAVHVISLQCLW